LKNIGQDGKDREIWQVSLLDFLQLIFYQFVYVVMPQKMEFNL